MHLDRVERLNTEAANIDLLKASAVPEAAFASHRRNEEPVLASREVSNGLHAFARDDFRLARDAEEAG
jgi:hypothetical protein